jgi:cell division protein FtsI (penicillin-binding protein 3)/stage V sporulation protein D (sporulation-specific penicillin-binding protein)
MVDSPQTGEIYGTEVAAPAWQKIMDFALPYLKIAPG